MHELDSKFFHPHFSSQHFPFSFFNCKHWSVFLLVIDLPSEWCTKMLVSFSPQFPTICLGMLTFQTITDCTYSSNSSTVQYTTVILPAFFCLCVGLLLLVWFFFFGWSFLTKCPRTNIFYSLWLGSIIVWVARKKVSWFLAKLRSTVVNLLVLSNF